MRSQNIEEERLRRRDVMIRDFAREWKVREKDVHDYITEIYDRDYMRDSVLAGSDFDAWRIARGVIDALRKLYYELLGQDLDKLTEAIWAMDSFHLDREDYDEN